MATSHIFGGRKITEPGVYVQTKSGIQNPPRDLDYGKVLLIDLGQGAGYGGAGVNGELSNGGNAIYEFNTAQEFQQFTRGGVMWSLAEALFRPNGIGSIGVSTLYFAHARETTAATITLAFAADDFVVKTKREGVGADGVESSSVLTKGFAATLHAGVLDTNKFIVKFWEGTYRGAHSDGSDFDLPEASTSPRLIVQSDEVATIDELVAWANSSALFKQYFSIVGTPTGTIIAGDLVSISGNQLATGGSETYNATDVDDLLEEVAELDYTFVLTDDEGSDASSAANLKVLAHLVEEAKYVKFLVVGGGATSDEFVSQSIAAAQTYDSSRAIVVHGGILNASSALNGAFREFSALYKAAYVVGRIAGLEPQTPITFKALNYDGERHTLKKKERTQGLEAGVLMTKFDIDLGTHIVIQGINTLQLNEFVVNSDGTSHLIQVERINAQLTREIIANAKLDLLGNQQSGPNRNIPSPEDVEVWLAGYLNRRTATDQDDNLILSFQDINISIDGDAYFITFGYEPNFEVNKLFFTAFILDTSI